MADVGSLRLGGQPFPFGVTFIPPEVLVAGNGPASSDAVLAAADRASRGTVSGASPEDFARACANIGASFAFVPRGLQEDDYAAALRVADIATFHVLDGPLWPLIEARGVMEGLRSTLTDPEGFGDDLDRGVRRLQDGLAETGRLGARALVLAEDLAGSEGPLVAPDFAIAELMPRYAPFVQHARELGMPAVLHSDGDIRSLLPAIARAGFVGVHAGGGLRVDAFVRLVHAAREEGLSVIGGLLTGELTSATRAEALGGALGRLARGGGLVLADDGGITTVAQLERLKIALDVARTV